MGHQQIARSMYLSFQKKDVEEIEIFDPSKNTEMQLYYFQLNQRFVSREI